MPSFSCVQPRNWNLETWMNDPRHSGLERFSPGCQGMSDFLEAKKGDRTMLDALWPAAEALASAVETGQNRALALATAIRAAKEGAQATRHIVARRGRSSYLGDRALGHPGPGAVGVGVWLEACGG